MDRLAPVLAVVALVGAWHLLVYKLSRGRGWSPLWLAFSTTAAALLFLVAGSIGYMLDEHDRFVSHTAWAGGVIWPEVAIGVGMGVAAVYFWRKALRQGSLS